MLSTWLVHHIQRDDMAYVKDVTHYLHHNLQQNASEHGWLARTLKRIIRLTTLCRLVIARPHSRRSRD
jgi:hypothetical protein